MTTHTAVADRLSPFGTTIFSEMTRLAIEHDAINLSQGFPDFDGPDFIKQAAIKAMGDGENQYARSFGVPALTRALSDHWSRETGFEIDDTLSVTVTSGCTEAIAATTLGILNPGDEVVVFQPYYDSYRACLSMAGAIPRFVTLHPPANSAETCVESPFSFDESELRAAFTNRTRAILLNTPHNPTGKVFSREELELIAALCLSHDAIAITDEVYEHLVYEPETSPHVRLATIDGMQDRTVTLSSLGKSFSLTGWKIGWAIAPPHLTAAVRSAHQFLTFATSTPFQHAAAVAIRQGDDYIRSLVADYRRRRDLLADGLAEIGFKVFKPAGSYFILADHTSFGSADDVGFCRRLIEDQKVAGIPPSAFYEDPSLGSSLVRFAFCKRDDTLRAALERMRSLRS